MNNVFLVALVYICFVWLFFDESIFDEKRKNMSSDNNELSGYKGVLGGISVVLPYDLVMLVEYDDDPPFGERPKTKVTRREADSAIRSFMILLEFPGMTRWVDAVGADERDRLARRISVSVTSGKHYSGAGDLDRKARVVLDPESYPGDYWWNNYREDTVPVHGLTRYSLIGEDPETGEPASESSLGKSIYLKKNVDGQVETYIRCSNPAYRDGPFTCRMEFSLLPEFNAGVDVGFDGSMLSDWYEIKNAALCLIARFKVN